MEFDTKALSILDFTVKAVDDVEGSDPNGEFYCVLSTEVRDREGEVVDAKALTLPDRMTIDVDHGLSVMTTVGSGVPSYEGELLVVRGTYSSIPRAQEVRTLVREGHIRTMSVAIWNATREKDAKGVTHVRSGELLNAAFCAVPVNPEALMLAAKSLRSTTSKATKGDRLQQIHDLAVTNGAVCAPATKSMDRPPTTKAVAGSYEDRQEILREALVAANTAAIAAAYPTADPGEYEWRLSIVATFDDHVVYRIGWEGDEALQVTYAWDGEQAAITGTPESVQIDQIITPATPDLDTQAAAATAPKAVSATAVIDEDSLQIRARALQLVALAAS